VPTSTKTLGVAAIAAMNTAGQIAVMFQLLDIKCTTTSRTMLLGRFESTLSANSPLRRRERDPCSAHTFCLSHPSRGEREGPRRGVDYPEERLADGDSRATPGRITCSMKPLRRAGIVPCHSAKIRTICAADWIASRARLLLLRRGPDHAE